MQSIRATFTEAGLVKVAESSFVATAFAASRFEATMIAIRVERLPVGAIGAARLPAVTLLREERLAMAMAMAMAAKIAVLGGSIVAMAA